jgi:hypothetical protein
MNNYVALRARRALTSQSSPHKRRQFDLPWATLVTSLVIGTILILVNHADTLFAGQANLSLTWIAPLTYLVSLWLVAVSGAMMSPGRNG